MAQNPNYSQRLRLWSKRVNKFGIVPLPLIGLAQTRAPPEHITVMGRPEGKLAQLHLKHLQGGGSDIPRKSALYNKKLRSDRFWT